MISGRNFGAGQFCRGMNRSPFVSVFFGRLRGMGGALRRCILPAPGGSGLDSFQRGVEGRAGSADSDAEVVLAGAAG